MATLDEFNKVMVIMAHPDDAEFTSAGTVAKWVAEGREVIYVMVTSGDKGSGDLAMTSDRLAPIREQEQLDVARVLGLKEVLFLRYPDGGVEDTADFRRQLVRLIRQYKPDIVMTHDPYRKYNFHRDHRVVGSVTMDAIFPAARDHLYFPELMAEGFTPHKVAEIYLWGPEIPDCWIDISETFDKKMDALRCHVSQVGSAVGLETRMREWAAIAGEKAGYPLAEAFKKIEMRR